MKRRLFTILSALSLVLCLASAGRLVRSGFAGNAAGKTDDHGRMVDIQSRSGTLTVTVARYSQSIRGDRSWTTGHSAPEQCPECGTAVPAPVFPPAPSPSGPAGFIGGVLLSDLL